MPIPYDIIVTAVSDRADLFVESMESLLANVDQRPARIIVHEDVRPGTAPTSAIRDWLSRQAQRSTHQVSNPARGLGPAMVWGFETALAGDWVADPAPPPAFALYTQEDWRIVRPLPISAALGLMDAHGLNHIRFNKRKTMRAKHADTPTPWPKVEISFDVAGGGQQVLCASDHWYTQTSLWRVATALPGLRAAAAIASDAHHFVPHFNHWMNATYGGASVKMHEPGAGMTGQQRHERMRTYIWGPIGEPKFIEHTGSQRGTGAIVDHLAPKVR